MAGVPNPWGLWLAVLACLLNVGDAQTSGDTFNVQGYSPDQAALIKVKRAIPNWNLYQQRSTCFGWVEQPVDTVCQWTSVKCNAEGRVTTLHFQTNASFHLGSIENVMAAAQELSELQTLNVAGQAFSGTLPTQYSFPKLVELDLSNNNIGGTIPELWGVYQNFPKLVNLSLAFNPPLSGSLPAGWGSDNSSLTSLQNFDANNCNLTGPLPGGWAAQLPALTNVNISSNALTGTLPANWTSLKSLRTLNLDRNALTGTIPASWGMNGAFPYLARLSLFANQLTGSIPAAWGASKNPFSGTMPRSAFPSLQWMDVANNLLSGRVPDFGNAPSGSSIPYFITNGNNFCGTVPGSLSVWDCTSVCQKPDGSWPACAPNGTALPLPPKPQTPTIAQATSSDMAVLLTLTKVIPNWDIFARTQSLNWTSTTTMCQSWQGVQCQGPYVIGLNFSEPDPDKPQRPPILQGVDNVTVHGSMPIALQGDIGQVLTILQRLPKLATLDFTNAYLAGSIPSNLTFPALQSLLLSSNDIRGTLPADWANQSAVPQLKYLDLSYNYQVSGAIPDDWGNGEGLQSLTKLSFHSCNLTGTLPVSWVDGLPVLSALDLAYNYLTGTLPVQWANMSALQTLSIVGNGISGTLPDGWGLGGPNTWSALSELHLDANHLKGTLPMSWGSTGAFPQIQNITLANNELTGSIPNNWGTDQNLHSPFPNLKSITLLPQQVTSAGLCGSIPSGLNVQQKMEGVFSRVTYLKPCSVSAATVQVQAKTSQSTAAPNKGAVVGGIIGGLAVLAALTAVVALLVLRQRRRNRSGSSLFGKAMSGDEKLQLDPYSMDMDMHDSDNIIPPKSTAAPASIVPFAQAPSSMNFSQGAQRSGSLNKRASLGARSGSVPKDASFASQGSGYSSEPAREGDAKPETLPHMFSKDWELNLDALEIELDEDGNEVELGKGAFGVVVKGRYRLSPVAVKRLINQTPEQQAQFLKEMAILRACRGSRYIVPFVGASLQPGNTILAMDYMENGNLWDQLPRTNKAGQHIFQWKFRGKKVAYEIALGLHCLHDLKVVHLDLKSSNVLIAADGSAKISDVGLAALMSQNYLSQMAPAGTWSWVAPEVILGGKVTNKADIYSFGVVIWEICTLERPAWRGMLRDIRVPEEAPQEVADLVVRCTGDAEVRPSAQEIAELLASFLPLAGARRASSRTMSGESARSPKAPAAGQLTSPRGPAPRSSGASSPPVSGTAGQPKVPGGAPPKSPFGGTPPVSGTVGLPTLAGAAPKSPGSNPPGSANGAF